ncbi:hypothetical protein C9F11_13240 [Streptomyces sp. YIM 121038]|uniref:hypothetical protein n=1 Tax=Streptomyces sp. YIM 121038 TaxID=2136401 RepID=UPI0011107718|nr:hypothetical protein [Streptomyces sp. YIM 121038]QCX76325.1 hypothetical protein C9F11_13240 [Streptomyces sp. YIM 121038]
MRLRALVRVPLPVLLAGALAAGCASPAPRPPAPRPDDVIKAAQQRLTDGCLRHRGFTPPRPGERPPPAAERQRVAAALFGTGRTELSLTLPTGHTVGAHTDGCLAAAQRALYGDQKRWFRVSTVVNNLKPEAAHADRPLAEVRAGHRPELTQWRQLRARALKNAETILTADDLPADGTRAPRGS